MSAANRQTQSKDPYYLSPTGGDAGNFRIIVRFFDDHETECEPSPSRDAATERSPWRKPWDDYTAESELRGGERKSLSQASSARGTSRK
jgi:hypothetical protein